MDAPDKGPDLSAATLEEAETRNEDGTPEGSFGDAVRALIEDGQTLVEAEISLRKTQARYGLGQARTILLLLALALAFGFFTLLAIVVGLLLALTPLIGVWAALAAVGGGLLMMTAACLAMARGQIKTAMAALAGKGPLG